MPSKRMGIRLIVCRVGGQAATRKAYGVRALLQAVVHTGQEERCIYARAAHFPIA